MTFATKPVWNP